MTVTELAPPSDELAALKRQLARQETVLEITRSFASAPTLDDLLLTVGEQTSGAIHADRTTFFLVDERSSTLFSRSATQLEIGTIRIPIGVGMAGHVAVTGEILNVPDCYEHPIWSKGKGPELDKLNGYLTRTMLVMPVKAGSGKIIGVFQILNKLRANGQRPLPGEADWPLFDDEDVELMESIAASAAIAVQNAYLVEQTKNLFTSTVQVLATTLDRRDEETAGHSQRVALIAQILAKAMGLPPVEVEKIRIAGLLHDVGKIGVPESILTFPGKYNDEQFSKIKAHARITREILEQIEFLEGYEDIPIMAGQHHEKLSGKGYPRGEKGDEITLGGRLLTVADIFDALRQRRRYKPEMPIEKALSILREEVQFGALDPKAVALLEQNLEEIESACLPLRPKDPPPEAPAPETPVASAAPAAAEPNGSSSSHPTPAPVTAASP
ncbi:MAG TPA: HD domain-containing phosphohydrolase, partial [Chloroflexota bacterium]|nr:HD domain-containing phosphohydrolase [Chloroflexota bacterium]